MAIKTPAQIADEIQQNAPLRRTERENIIAAIEADRAQHSSPDEYADRKWNGVDDVVIESETDPWIVKPDGSVMDFGDVTHSPLPGVVVCGTAVQAEDDADIYPTDLHAARALADAYRAVFGHDYEVWYRGA